MAITDEIPKSRITLTYRTNVSGEAEEVTLPLRVLIMGDLSKGTSKDKTVGLDKRQIRRLDGKNLPQVMSDMDMSLKFAVKNRINPAQGGEEFEVKLPIKSTKSFLPVEVAKEVPRIQALLLLKKLLLEAQANFDNRKDFRNLLRELAQSEDAIKAIRTELPLFGEYKLPRAAVKLVMPDAIAALPGLEVRIIALPESKVRRDEEVVRATHWPAEVSLKPGKYQARVFAPGKLPWSAAFEVRHDNTLELPIGPLADEPAPAGG